jgi:hypothetical protein
MGTYSGCPKTAEPMSRVVHWLSITAGEVRQGTEFARRYYLAKEILLVLNLNIFPHHFLIYLLECDGCCCRRKGDLPSDTTKWSPSALLAGIALRKSSNTPLTILLAKVILATKWHLKLLLCETSRKILF